MNIEYKSYKEKYKIGKRITLNNLNNLEKEFTIIKKELDNLNIKAQDKIICYFETTYQENNMDTFIGYTLVENIIPKDIGTLEIITNSKANKQLIGYGTNIKDIIEEMNNYAEKNNIQIRGFYNIVLKKELEIYVEAFDLKEDNEDYIKYLNNFQKNIELDNSLIGKYQIKEILPNLKYMYNPNKQKSNLDTKYKILELKKDGTTNYDNITWSKEYLYIKIKDIEIPLSLHKYIHNNTVYLDILMNEDYKYYKSQRPIEYLYEKI